MVGVLFGRCSVVGFPFGRWSVVNFWFGRWSMFCIFTGRWSVFIFENGQWSVVCGRWLVGGRWFCTTPPIETCTKLLQIGLVFIQELENQVRIGSAIWYQIGPIIKVIPCGTEPFQS